MQQPPFVWVKRQFQHDKVRNTGAMFDSEMKMGTQVNTMCKSAWFHLYMIGKIRSYLSDDQTKSVVHAYVTSKLDGNNALLIGPRRDYLIDKLQLVQNAAAKIITKSKKFDHVTPLLRQLHWLPISKRITFKVLLLVYKSFNDMGPVYLRDLLIYYKPKREGLRHDHCPWKSLELSLSRTVTVPSVSLLRKHEINFERTFGQPRQLIALKLTSKPIFLYYN